MVGTDSNTTAVWLLCGGFFCNRKREKLDLIHVSSLFFSLCFSLPCFSLSLVDVCQLFVQGDWDDHLQPWRGWASRGRRRVGRCQRSGTDGAKLLMGRVGGGLLFGSVGCFPRLDYPPSYLNVVTKNSAPRLSVWLSGWPAGCTSLSLFCSARPRPCYR